MPATLFNASHAVIAHSLVPLDSSTLDALKEESYLLVHSARCSGTNDFLEEVDITGAVVYAAYFNFKVRWSVEATALALAGLANYHPGANLTTQNLEFLNASRNAFQIGLPSPDANGRRLIYENPVQDPVAGDLVEVSFDVVSMFGTSYGPGAVAPPVDLESSLVPEVGSGADYAYYYNVSQIWIRRLRVVGPVTGLTYFNDEYFWYTSPLTVPAAVDLPAFYASQPPSTAANTIMEVFATDVPGGRVLLAGAGLITDLVSHFAPIPLPSTSYNWFIGVIIPGEGTYVQSALAPPEVNTAQELITYLQSPGDAPGFIGTAQVLEVYSMDQAAFLPL